MKTLFTLLACVTGLAVMAPVTAEAGPGHRHGGHSSASHCDRCGGRVYRERVFVGYDRCGEPVYSWRTSHRCRPQHDHGHGHGHGHGGRGHGHGHGGHGHGHSHSHGR